jgi:hypothetical protein
LLFFSISGFIKLRKVPGKEVLSLIIKALSVITSAMLTEADSKKLKSGPLFFDSSRYCRARDTVGETHNDGRPRGADITTSEF